MWQDQGAHDGNIPAYTAAGWPHPSLHGSRQAGRPIPISALYGVPTKRLNEQGRGNPQRFPQDFVFLLSAEEWESVKSQIASSKNRRGLRRRFLPYAFTPEGALMAGGLLTSRRAIDVSIYIIRSFFAMKR